MNKSTVAEQPQVRLAGGPIHPGNHPALPPGAAKVLLQMLREASLQRRDVHCQPSLAA